MKAKYLGYRPEDRAQPHARFYDENVKPLASGGLGRGGCPPGSLPPVGKVPDLSRPGYADLETGYTLEADGSIRVAVLTAMPRVVPDMWDWWFGWHGCADSRYKLWHPKAHLAAQWKDGNESLASYIGRVSMIEEYIGKSLEKANIRFVDPAELGLPGEATADKKKAVFICARVGYTNIPLDFGWLVHQIRAVDGGSEMRSRFWMGGSHIQWRGDGAVSQFFSRLIRKVKRLPEQQAVDLLTHCSEEMNHLAAFLPEIHAAFADAKG